MRGIVAGLLCLLLSACAGSRVDVRLPDTNDVNPSGTKPRPRHVRDVLLLSSGGADGAFGAGVLAGWTARGTRPVFDVVTGISTGALQATPAFLGEAYDDLLREVYTTTRTADVLDRNGPGVLVKAGLYDLEPLRARLRTILTDTVLDHVAAEHRAGRRLIVGTTDLTNGRLVAWDMGAIAASGDPDRGERYVGVLLASVAVPGLIEPVIVRDAGGREASHGDGGVKAPVLFDRALLPGPGRRRATVWVVANGHVSPVAATAATIDDPVAAGRRGVSQLLRRLLHTTVVATYFRVRERGAAFRLIALPDDVPEARDPLAFEPGEMLGLYEVGVSMGRAGTGWMGAPPGVRGEEAWTTMPAPRSSG